MKNFSIKFTLITIITLSGFTISTHTMHNAAKLLARNAQQIQSITKMPTGKIIHHTTSLGFKMPSTRKKIAEKQKISSCDALLMSILTPIAIAEIAIFSAGLANVASEVITGSCHNHPFPFK